MLAAGLDPWRDLRPTRTSPRRPPESDAESSAAGLGLGDALVMGGHDRRR